jgi:hypothetical protein
MICRAGQYESDTAMLKHAHQGMNYKNQLFALHIRCTDFIDNLSRRDALAAFDPPHDRVANGLLPVLEPGLFHCWGLRIRPPSHNEVACACELLADGYTPSFLLDGDSPEML